MGSSPSNFNKSVELFALIHSNVWGPTSTPNISATKQFVSFIDDCMRVTWLVLMKDK